MVMGEWANGRLREWANGRMGEWANGRMGEWANGRMGEWINTPDSLIHHPPLSHFPTLAFSHSRIFPLSHFPTLTFTHSHTHPFTNSHIHPHQPSQQQCFDAMRVHEIFVLRPPE